jgi:hypothetical protein
MTVQMLNFLKIKLPVILAAVLLIPIYSLPVWWVSLTAPNYPVESFPDGVKIHFHMTGVFNGCQPMEDSGFDEGEALDCVHEMDTINHYVGMFPIASGAPIELSLSFFLLILLGLMLLSSLIDDPKKRMIAMSAGFSIIAVWLVLALYLPNGLKYHSAEYLSGRVTALGQEGGDDEVQLSAGEALIASLKASLAMSGVEVDEPVEEDQDEIPQGQKGEDIAFLKDAFESSQKRLAIDEEWEGTGSQLLGWHYRASLARYFNNPEVINPKVETMTMALNIVFGLLIIIMIVFVFGARKTNGWIYKLLLLIPATLPGLFILIYSTWLGWYGHRMSDMGAFTLKPFMPTVFGQGKVAQFTTNSYPHIGFFLMLLVSALLVYSLLARRDIQNEIPEDSEL